MWALQGGRLLRRVLRRGSRKGLSRRHLEGRNTPFQEYDAFASALRQEFLKFISTVDADEAMLLQT